MSSRKYFENWCEFEECPFGLLIKPQSYHHTETSQFIGSANQLTSFYLVATLVFNELSTKKSKYLTLNGPIPDKVKKMS